jgi:penicillin amidase
VLLDGGGVWYGGDGRDAVFRRVAARTLHPPVEPWGRRHTIVLRHLLLGGRLPRWLGLDRGPVAVPGGRATVHQGQIYRSGNRDTSFVPSFRLVTDLAERAAHTALAGGASDRPWSRWYASGIRDWQAGRLKRLAPGAREDGRCTST